MLYVHCGWPGTGTTGLQLALYANRDRLGAAGVVYPDRWQAKKPASHHGLYQLVSGTPDSRARLDDFRRFFAEADGDVLLSAEGITNWLQSSEMREGFLELLAVAGESMPTRCVWTLRRFDAMLESMYLVALRLGRQSRTPTAYFSDLRLDDFLFEAMRAVEDTPGNQAVYVEYDPAGSHNRELLRAFGIPDQVVSALGDEMDHTARRNVGLTHKQAVVLANLAEISARLGMDLSASDLRAAFDRGGLAFDDDRRCELVTEELKKEVHERALAAAREHRISAYLEFFADAEVHASAHAGLGVEAITDDDLERLLAHLRAQRSAEPGRAAGL
jgi:hypothetical protein